jgi:hypothetical protein
MFRVAQVCAAAGQLAPSAASSHGARLRFKNNWDLSAGSGRASAAFSLWRFSRGTTGNVDAGAGIMHRRWSGCEATLPVGTTEQC